MSQFADVEQIVSDAIDAWYGDYTSISRQTRGKFFGASANGEALIVPGIVDENPLTVRVQDESQYDGLQPQLAGDRWHVSYDISKFPNGADDLPDESDVITILKADLSRNMAFPKLRVTRVDHDGIGRVVCVCTKAE